MCILLSDVLGLRVTSQQHTRPKQFYLEEVLLEERDKVVAERERGRGILLIYMENDVTQVKVGGEPSVFWEQGSYCLDKRSVGCTVAYVMSKVWEVLMPTHILVQQVLSNSRVPKPLSQSFD